MGVGALQNSGTKAERRSSRETGTTIRNATWNFYGLRGAALPGQKMNLMGETRCKFSAGKCIDWLEMKPHQMGRKERIIVQGSY